MKRFVETELSSDFHIGVRMCAHPHTRHAGAHTHRENHTLPAIAPIKKNNKRPKKKEIDCKMIVKKCHSLKPNYM